MIRVLLVAAVTSQLVATSPASAAIRECGETVSGAMVVLNITTRGVPCKTARPFARAASRRCSPPRCTYRRYRCTLRALEPETIDARCVRGARVIHWQFGV